MAAQQRVHLLIDCATDLFASDLNGKSDPFVKFWWQGKKYKTKVISNTLCPTWDESFDLSYQPGKDPNILRLEIWDKDRLNRNDPLGKVDLDFTKLQQSGSISDSWHHVDKLDGVGRGQVKIKVQFPDEGKQFTSTHQPAATFQLPSNPEHISSLSSSTSAKETVFQKPNKATPQTNKVDWSVDEIQRVLPQLKPEQIKKALKQFNGDREKALCHLIDKQVELAIQTSSNQKAQVAHPPLGNYGQSLRPEAYTVTYNPRGAAEKAQIRSDTMGLKPAAQVIQDPNVVYAGQGRKKALLIGINYLKTKEALKGCIRDVQRMKKVLVGIYGFPDIPEAIVMLTDDNSDRAYQPTRRNIICAMRWLVEDAKPGDVLFFHFSGKGAQVPNKKGTEEDGMDEAIFPCDYDSEGAIIDDEMHALLVQPLPSGSRLTAVMDCSHSGTGLDLSFIWDSHNVKWEEEFSPIFTQGDVQLFSACSDNQEAADEEMLNSVAHSKETGGLVTLAFVTALAANPWGHTYPSLLEALQNYVTARGCKKQHPQLTSSQKFSVKRQFNLTDIVPNNNEMLGRPFKKNKKKQLSAVKG